RQTATIAQTHGDDVANCFWITPAQFLARLDLHSTHQGEKAGIRNAFRLELLRRHLSIEQGDCNDVRQTVIRRLAAGRVPFLRLAPDYVHSRAVAFDQHRFDLLRAIHLRPQLERGFDGALRVVFGRPEFDARPRDHKMALTAFPPVADSEVERNAADE